MLDREYIQSRGFRNLFKNGKAVGFQVCVRTSYYRGLFLSQLRPVEIKVDGETFKGDQITMSFSGKTYEQKDFGNFPDDYWPILEPAVFTIKKPGGLKVGSHEVEFGYAYTVCYEAVPPDAVLDLNFSKRQLILCK
jgi:hypothetical protein